MTEETEEVNMLKDQNCLAAFEEGQFLWPSAKANVGDGDASARGSEDLCFFRLVSGDMHRRAPTFSILACAQLSWFGE